jgi:hypothetical protein
MPVETGYLAKRVKWYAEFRLIMAIDLMATESFDSALKIQDSFPCPGFRARSVKLEEFRSVIRQKPDDGEAHCYLAHLLLKSGATC